ncbi:trace amine-associated receptor 3-like [Oculina patagonica]
MAAITSHVNFWNLTSKEALHYVWLFVDNTKAITLTVSAVAMIMCPIIVFGNSLVVLSVWRDPLKSIRSSPPDFILLSMAVADLLVGLVACPLTLYWHWAMTNPEFESFLPLLVGSTLVNVSIGHTFLLTIDRFYALVTPLRYKVKVTNNRVCIAAVTCWIYFLLFGCAFGLLENYYTIIAAVHNLQILFCLPCYHNLWFMFLSNALSVILTFANSGINPFLYAWRLQKYRDTFKHLMKKRTRRCGNQNKQVNDTRL